MLYSVGQVPGTADLHAVPKSCSVDQVPGMAITDRYDQIHA